MTADGMLTNENTGTTRGTGDSGVGTDGQMNSSRGRFDGSDSSNCLLPRRTASCAAAARRRPQAGHGVPVPKE